MHRTDIFRINIGSVKKLLIIGYILVGMTDKAADFSVLKSDHILTPGTRIFP
jgi:hypothetical protein